MTRATNIKFLKTLQTRAPRNNRNRIQEVIDRYESHQINNFKTAQNAALALMMPSMHKPQDVERLVNKAVQHVIPQRLKRNLQLDFTLKVLLFTSTEEKDPNTNAIVELSEDEQKKYKKYMTKKVPRSPALLGRTAGGDAGIERVLRRRQGQDDKEERQEEQE